MKLSTLPSLTALVLALALAACTKPNPAVCCLDAADCDEVGIPEVRGCSQGLACVDHQCTVPTCAEAGCGAEAPVCNVVTDACDPCSDSSECDRFADTPVCGPAGSCVQCVATGDCASRAATPVCETTSQTCVECLGESECSVLEPICENNACRAPQSDNDCPSLALATDGTCVPEAEVVYLSPTGTDVGSCNRAVPCLTLAFGVSKTNGARSHIVFAPGQYSTNEELYDSADTSAPSLHLHGHGAEVNGPTGGDGTVMSYSVAVVIWDLKVSSNTTGAAIQIYAGPSLLERVVTAGSTGVAVSAAVTMRDFKHTERCNVAIRVESALTLDRAVISGCNIGIQTYLTGATVQVSNTIIHSTDNRALDLGSTGASGTIVSSTIVTAGAAQSQTTGGRAVHCASTAILLRSTIVWSPNAGAQSPVVGCSLTNVIAGPANVAGSTNVDPMFVNAATDYHLAAGSPARDAVDTGPATDFEGDARPRGARFDIGADEAMP